MKKHEESPNEFFEVVKIIKRHFLFILIFVAVCFSASVTISLLKPNIYKSEVKIHPGDKDSAGGLGALAGQFGGLASIAGLNFGGGNDENLIVETLKSRSFLKLFIEKNAIKVPLMASMGWEQSTDQLIFDEDVYSVERRQWVRNVKPPKVAEPTLEEAYENLLEKIEISLDKKSKFINVSVFSYSPRVSKEWAEKLIEDLSEYLREKDKEEAKNAIAFLQAEQEKTQYVEIKNVFLDLLKEQYQKLTLTEIKKYYGFEIRDNAYIPEKKNSPSRIVIIILGTFLGLILSIILVFLRLFFKEVVNA